MRERRQTSDSACMPGIHQGAPTSFPSPSVPPPPFFLVPPLGSGGTRGLQPLSYARARASASASGPSSSFLRVDFLLSQSQSPSLSLSLPLSPASSIKRASFDSARPRAAGEWRREGGTSGLRLSKNEMRLKKQGRPSSRPRSRSFSRRRGMGVLMSTYLSPRSVEQNSEAARREQYFASTNMGAQLSYRVQPPAF